MARQFTDEERERMARGGEWLRAERTSRGFEHGTEFADALGIKAVRLSAYERGLYPIPERIARDIARVLKITEWQVWRGLQLPLPRELDDDEAIARAWELAPEVMEKVTGLKPPNPSTVTSRSVNRRTTDTRSGGKRRNADQGRESAG